jgi:hypothetical protein
VMVTYLYCVLTPPRVDAPGRGLSGVGGSSVRSLVIGEATGLEAWVSTVDEAVLRVTGRALASQALLHNEVVEAALATGRTPLPTRFGSHFADDERCVEGLARRSASLIDVLGQLAGTVEMSVLLVPSRRAAAKDSAAPPTRDEPSAGRRYLESLREKSHRAERAQRAADTIVARIDAALRGIARAEARSRTGTGIARIAHLLSGADVHRYREAIGVFAPTDEFRLVISGPRAPYSFVGSAAPQGGHDSSSPNDNG